ncbi:hypothetical protein FQ008_04250 [Escherichia coli]|nr:hypothetical protein [Escherichia coli]MXE27439.1 hypothetical protein [Escherichia coli]
MAIIIYPRHGIWYIAWVGISNPIPVDGVVTVRAYPLYVKQEDFSDITATAKHQFRDQYARVASTAYTLDIHFVTNAISSGIRIDKINRTMIHF